MIGSGVRSVAGVAVVLLLTGSWTAARAGTTGRIAGRVLDAAKQPLAGANVAVPTARTGAVTDDAGRYLIVNVPAGTHEVRASLIGRQTVLVQNVVVSADNTTSVDITLKEAPLEVAEVVVTAQRPVVDVNQTSQFAAVTREEINSLPVEDLRDVVNLQAGVVEGHFRGGRLGEVQYQVDGVTVNNPYDNTSSLRLDRSLLEEVQVISGTFDAEYGQAMSGVVNAALRTGGEKFQLEGEAYAGGFYYSETAGRLVPYEFEPANATSLQLTGSGPTGLPATTFLVTGRIYDFDDYVRGSRRFVPTDTSDFENKVFTGTGDGAEVTLGVSQEWSGAAKLKNHSIRNLDVGYQAIWNRIEGRRSRDPSPYAYRLNPDGLATQKTFSIVHGLDVTQALGKSSFYRVTLRQNYFEYKDMVYDDVFDPRYDAAGPPRGDPDYELGAYVQGVDFTRFEQSTNAFVAKGTFEGQVARDHHVKVGGEYQYTLLQFGHPGYLVFTTVPGQPQQVLVRHVDEPPSYPGLAEYRPVIAAGFAQDELEWNDLRLRAGLRFDFFDARAFVPSDLANPGNTIEGAPESHPVDTGNKLSFAPRLGVSYPVTRDAALFFAYGHFYQMPALGTMFDNADYRVLSELQAGGISYGVLGNPDVRPERTVQYQFGYKQAVTDWLGLDLSAYYKDIRDLLGVEFVSTYNGAEYARLTNVDFGSVIGLTLALDQRPRGWLSTAMDYTWQFAQGNSSDPRETATRAEAGEDPQPRLVPLNWDQRHTFNLTANMVWPRGWSSSAILRIASGQPYTPVVTAGFSGGLETNSGRKPWSVLLDLRGERAMRFGGLGATLFARVFNVFDARYSNGSVFSSTGSPYYSRFPSTDAVTLNDPTRFYAPRRIDLGILFRGLGKS